MTVYDARSVHTAYVQLWFFKRSVVFLQSGDKNKRIRVRTRAYKCEIAVSRQSVIETYIIIYPTPLKRVDSERRRFLFFFTRNYTSTNHCIDCVSDDHDRDKQKKK